MRKDRSPRRETIRGALARVTLPALRSRGFVGELPDLRRMTSTATHLFTVQTSKWGGRFIVELGRAPAGVYTTARGEVIEPPALACFHLPDNQRARLRSTPTVHEEAWFRYAPTFGERLRQLGARLLRRSVMTSHERAARQVLALLPECDRWWAGEDGLPHVRSFAEQRQAQEGRAPGH